MRKVTEREGVVEFFSSQFPVPWFRAFHWRACFQAWESRSCGWQGAGKL